MLVGGGLKSLVFEDGGLSLSCSNGMGSAAQQGSTWLSREDEGQHAAQGLPSSIHLELAEGHEQGHSLLDIRGGS